MKPSDTQRPETLPPSDVDLSELGGASGSIGPDVELAPERPSRTLTIDANDAAALRRVLGAIPVSSSPPPPSMSMRAAKATGRGALISSAVLGAVTLAGALSPEVVRALLNLARTIGEFARAIRDGFAG